MTRGKYTTSSSHLGARRTRVPPNSLRTWLGTSPVAVPCASLVHPLCIWTNNVNAGWQRRWVPVGGKHGCITRSAGGQSYPRRVSGDSPKILPGIQHRFGSWNSGCQGRKNACPSRRGHVLASGTGPKCTAQSLQKALTACSNGCLRACSPSLKVSRRLAHRYSTETARHLHFRSNRRIRRIYYTAWSFPSVGEALSGLGSGPWRHLKGADYEACYGDG